MHLATLSHSKQCKDDELPCSGQRCLCESLLLLFSTAVPGYQFGEEGRGGTELNRHESNSSHKNDTKYRSDRVVTTKLHAAAAVTDCNMKDIHAKSLSYFIYSSKVN